MRALVLATLVLSGSALAAEAYVPPPADSIPGYWETPICSPGREDDPDTGQAESRRPDCPVLYGRSLRELSLLRNTIFARYGWAGFRKTWLREHFQRQPWFKPNPKFSYKLLSDVDRQNVRAIARYELSFTYQDLEEMRDMYLARAGKRRGGAPGTSIAPDFRKLTPEQRIELGLLSRAMGSFASDDASRGQVEKSLDEVLSLKELRELSLRDLRLLRNTLYARRGRPFQSPLLQKHFARMPWYKADPAYTDARLTKNDLRNVKLIRSVEKELGGALKDEDFLIADPQQREDPEEAPDPGFLSGA